MISQMTAAGFRPAMRARSMRAFGLSRAHEHAALAAAQRVDVPGPKQVLRLRVLGDGDFDRLGAVARAHAGRHAEPLVRIDRHRERRAHLGGVALDLRMKVELVAASPASARGRRRRARA